MMRWIPLVAGGGASLLGNVAGMPWGAQLVLGLTGLAVCFGRLYLRYRLGCKALERANEPGGPGALTHEGGIAGRSRHTRGLAGPWGVAGQHRNFLRPSRGSMFRKVRNHACGR